MKLSIIIPYYNALKYTKELMKVLNKQLTSEVEIIIIDDGCNESELDKFKAKVIHLDKNSGSASTPRNVGIENSTGEYITFVDADDMVSDDYIQTILNKINSETFDYCLFSWHYNGQDVIIKDNPPEWNTSACNCIYKRTLIGDERFNPKLRINEDGDFNSRVRKGKKANIEKVLYFYNTTNPNSVTYNARGWYFIDHANVFYANDIYKIGGVETYLYEMVKKYKDLDICVCYKSADKNQLKRLKKYCPVYKVDGNTKIKCKIGIINYDMSILDQFVEGDIYQTIHGDYSNPHYKRLGIKVPTDERLKGYIGITKYSAKVFEELTGNTPILSYNPLSIEKYEKPLVLLSTIRLRPEKGLGRMEALAKELDRQNIKYIWYIFSDDNWKQDNPNIICLPPRLDLDYFMEQADYLVHLSDTECCSYSINEMLYRNKPCILTPLPYLDEIGVKDGVNSYILEFDCSNLKEIVKKMKKIPKFTFKHLEDSYDKILAPSKSKYDGEDIYKVKVQCIKKQGYDDVELGRFIQYDEIIPELLTQERGEYLASKGAVKILEYIKIGHLEKE